MAPLTWGVARVLPEAAAAVARYSPTAKGAPAVAPILGLLAIPTEVVYMRPDEVIE